MGDYNKIEGVAEIPVAGGKSLRLSSRVTNGIKAKYEDWLESRARKRLFEMRSSMDSGQFKESLRSVQEACAAGTFSWGGDAWQASLQQLPGIVKLVCLLADDVEHFDESAVLEMMNDPVVSEMLTSSVRGIISATPNFLSPPTRGEQN